MELRELDNLQTIAKGYAGHSCDKAGLYIDNERYMVKIPGNTEELGIKKPDLKYTNSPICEYIGSQIYKSAGFKTHDVFLAKLKGKTVAACKDFCENGEELISYYSLATTRATLKNTSSLSNGHGQDLEIVMEFLNGESRSMQLVPELKDHFWDMFVMDAFIGNPDRNNDNWGILISYTSAGESVSIPPVYDNGNCLNDKFSDRRMQKALNDPKDMKALAYTGCMCYHKLNGRRMNPFQYMESSRNEDLNKAVLRTVPKIDMGKVDKILSELKDSNIISDTQYKYYSTILDERYSKALLPIMKKVQEHEAIKAKKKE